MIFYRLGTVPGLPRPFATDPKEMPQVVVQNVWPPRSPFKSLEDPHLL